MKITVDLNRCQGYAQCCYADAEVFRMHGEEALEFDPAPGEEHRLRVLQAAKACPVQAIRIGYEEQKEMVHE